PGEVVLRQLVLYACGLFIWAATACRFIREGRRFARKRLDTILKGSSSAITAPEKHLNEIYLAVLKHSISSDYSDEEKEDACDMLKHTVGSIVALLSPLFTSSLSRLLLLPKEEVDQTFGDLYAILDIPDDPTYPIRLYHPSFRDFLLNQDRCGDFWVNEKETLKKDICEMHALGSRPSQIESSRIQKCLPPEVQYACLYWVQHLQRSGSQVYDGDEAHRFLQDHLLHWIEALEWIADWSVALQTLEGHSNWVSSVAFSPDGKQVVSGSGDETARLWDAATGALLQTLEDHSNSVGLVAFSPDGKQVVSGSYDNTARLWDAATGALLQTLEGHWNSVSSVAGVAFSPDGKLLPTLHVFNHWLAEDTTNLLWLPTEYRPTC
ncbi:hypothetical protein IFR05_017314, partial [Cadophora sp. M221]